MHEASDATRRVFIEGIDACALEAQLTRRECAQVPDAAARTKDFPGARGQPVTLVVVRHSVHRSHEEERRLVGETVALAAVDIRATQPAEFSLQLLGQRRLAGTGTPAEA